MAANSAYPATLTGTLEEPLNRWLFLVKWLLIIPHIIVLVFLIAALVISIIISLFAILFSGRYPKGLFDFNVGVLRWGWRVQFYSYSALATDKYPPFSRQAGGYPADFTVDYPEQLSRGLVLVKWILAIPHFIIVGFFCGGSRSRGSGLIGTLSIFAGIANLFTGKYPPGLFSLVMALNRWVYRVTAYTALMTDRYPPFRLDQEG